MSTKAKQQSSQQMTRGFEPYQETKGEEYMSDACARTSPRS